MRLRRGSSGWVYSKEKRGRYLGGTGLHRIDWGVGAFEIGYWVRASAHGKGFVTEGAELLTKFAFEALHANRVSIQVAGPKTRGFGGDSASPWLVRLRGRFGNSVADVFGNLHDRLMFGMIPEQWRDLSPPAIWGARFSELSPPAEAISGGVTAGDFPCGGGGRHGPDATMWMGVDQGPELPVRSQKPRLSAH